MIAEPICVVKIGFSGKFYDYFGRLQWFNFSWNFFITKLLLYEKKTALALRCWHCSSKDQPYCSDPFDTDQLSPEQRAGNYADCNKGEFGRSVCLKMISKGKQFWISFSKARKFNLILVKWNNQFMNLAIVWTTSIHYNH